MVERITEELYLDSGSRRFHFLPGAPSSCVMEAGRHYSFELCRKAAVFGDIPVDQFWMEHASIYGNQKGKARNYRVLVEFYLAQCMKSMTVLDKEVLDSYILAVLLPFTRQHGARRVFDDAVLRRPNHSGERKPDLIRRLDTQLAQSRDNRLDMKTFHIRTAEFLGPPHLSDEVQKEYHGLVDELFGAGREAVQRKGVPGLQVSIDILQGWMKSFARRRGHAAKKQALDVLSYECRAAMHRCYSATWYELLSHLEQKYQFTVASLQYHRLMHFDISLPSNSPEADFHLFHGHIFALHPGISLFLQTKTGGELIAAYLCADNNQPFERLLHGFLVALVDYYVRSDQVAEARKKTECDSDDIELKAAQQTGGKYRRLSGPNAK